jgi:hypothetical protein
MPYSTSHLRSTRSLDATLQASTTQTATGTGSAFEMEDNGTLRLTLAVTAASGTTPTLDDTLQTSTDGSTGWANVAAFAQKTAAASERKIFTGLDRYARLSWVIGGTTPSFTFSCIGEAV